MTAALDPLGTPVARRGDTYRRAATVPSAGLRYS
jgi:hypothetical protein